MTLLEEINKDYIAIHKAEYFYANSKTIINLANMLEDLSNTMAYDPDRDLKPYELEELEGLLDKSKQYIQNIEYIIKIKRSKV